MKDGIRIIRLADAGDSRGRSFTPPPECFNFIGSVQDMHIATVVPRAVRGNHYHEHHREILIMIYSDQWSLHWDSGPGTVIQKEAFSGSGVVMVEIEPLASHAIRNDGKSDIYMIGVSNIPYNPEEADSHPRRVV